MGVALQHLAFIEPIFVHMFHILAQFLEQTGPALGLMIFAVDGSSGPK